MIGLVVAIICWSPTAVASAHPLVENAIDVVVSREQISVAARIAEEEVVLVESAVGRTSTDEQWQAAIERHTGYVVRHLHLRVDGREITGSGRFVDRQTALDAGEEDPSLSALVPYRLTYPLNGSAGSVEIGQDFLREFADWNAPCVLRIRRIDQTEFETSLLQRGDAAKLTCRWATVVTPAPPDSVRTIVNPWPIFEAFTRHGIEHILTGYDHLLFVTALVLGAGRLWDLVKVVTAFTLAHTLTLILSVFNIVTFSSQIVEPMIAASIVFVAAQNILRPEQSTGRMRLAIAFGFGLFHGLAFAGGLKEAMSDLPGMAMWLALVAFSLGVEIGHQVVVLPLYSLLAGARNSRAGRARAALNSQILTFGSAGITLAGVYFLFEAIR
ncbi:MAG TPA: HupE/UreJ family protein [Pirellulales bacterium]|nr:HupE/UreJ family protein [Pirellulales bacterium]